MAARLCVVLVVLSAATVAVAFEYADLEAMNATCPLRDSCTSDKRPRMTDDQDWKKRNCFCDDLCAEYGDCCLDAQAYDDRQQRDNSDNFECVNLRQFGEHYMQARCMEGWEDLEIALLCSSGSPDSSSDRRDPMADLPVTSLDTAVTYNNFYCAVCNNDSTSLELWQPRLECPTLTSYAMRWPNLTQEYVSSNLVYNDVSWGIYLADGGVEVFHACTLDPVPPETVHHLIRPCKIVTRECASDWHDPEVETLCQSYTAVVYDYETAYRNHHCSVCNHVTTTKCYAADFTRFYSPDNEFHPGSFAILFDFLDRSGSNAVGSTSSCGPGEVYDPFFKKCRNVVCGRPNQQYRRGRCWDLDAAGTTPSNQPRATFSTLAHSTTPPSTTSQSTTTTPSTSAHDTPTTTTTAETLLEVTTAETEGTDKRMIEKLTEESAEIMIGESSPTTTPPSDTTTDVEASEVKSGLQESTHTLTCERFLLPREEYTIGENGTVVVEKYGVTYQAHEYESREGGILVCIIQPDSNKFSRLMGWVTLAGMGLSCVCLLLHLGAFLLVPDLRNLSGKNLASLCVVLLAAYVTFILSVFGEPHKLECFVLAAMMYYFFLATFTWMSVMAFDIWRTLRMATSELRVTMGSQWRKFIVYSVYGWLMPGAALAAVVLTDLMRPEGMPEQYFPALGERWCWFGQRKALLVFFAAPLTFIMCTNIMLFIMSARIIALTTQSTAKMTSCSPHHNQFKLYMRLALIMGLTWISGIVAGYLQLEVLWYIFVLLNTLQGVFIFLAFTCTRKVWRVVGGGCWRRMVLARRGVSWVGRSPSSSRQGLESRDSNDSHLSQASHSSVTHLTSNASRL